MPSPTTIATSLVVAALAFSATARAEPVPLPNAPSMSLEQALEHARKHQPSLAAARLRLEAARHDATANDREWYPKISVGAQVVGATVNASSATILPMNGVGIARVGGTRMFAPTAQPYASTLVGLGVRQEIFDFGRLSAEAKVLDGLVRLEEAQSTLADLDVAYLTTSAYYCVLATKELLDAAESAFRRADAHRALAAAGARSGLRPPIDLTRAEADVARFDVGRVRAVGGVRSARGVLAAVIGTQEPEIDAVALAPSPRVLPSADAVANRAASASPAVQRAKASLRVQDARMSEVAARTRPRMYLDGSLDARGGGATAQDQTALGAGFVPQVPNYDVGLVFVWPLWEPTASARERAAKARRDAAEEDLHATRLSMARDARHERLRAEIAERTLEALDRSVAAAKANGEQAEARFRAGLGTSVEVSDAESLRIEAEVQLVSGQLEWMMARAALARVLSEKP